jgi:hypothetical protein
MVVMITASYYSHALLAHLAALHQTLLLGFHFQLPAASPTV